MPGLSDVAMDLVLNYYFRATAPAAPPGVTYAVLYNGDPDAGGTVAPGFNPILVENDGSTSPFWNAPDSPVTGSRRVRNNAAVNFGTASTNAGTVDHVGIHTTNTGLAAANRIGVAELSTPKTLGAGDTFQVPTNGLDIRITRT